MARKAEVVLPSSKIKMAIAKILKENNYLADIVEFGDVKKEMKLKLSYKNRQPAMQEAKRISKPGRRVYSGADDLPRALSGYGIVILSTSRGIMTNKSAKKLGIGGEVICEVY